MSSTAPLNPYQHRYLQASWNAYTEQGQPERVSKSWRDNPSAQADSFYNSSSTSAAGAAAVPTRKAVTEVSELQSIVEAQQAVLAGLRAQQQTDGAALGQMSRAVHELCSRWSVMEVWQLEEAEPRLVASIAAVGRFSHRLDDVQASLLDKPGRTELSASATAAVNPLAVQVASLRQSLAAVLDNSNLTLTKASSSSGADSPTSVALGKEELEAAVEAALAARLGPAVEAAVASALLSSREAQQQSMSMPPPPPLPPNLDGTHRLRTAPTAQNNGERHDDDAETKQQSLEIAVGRAEAAAHRASESATAAERSMHEYWTRVQAFVIAQLEDFESKQKKAISDYNRSLPTPLASLPQEQQQDEATATRAAEAGSATIVQTTSEPGTATGTAVGAAATDTDAKIAEAIPTIAVDPKSVVASLEPAVTDDYAALAGRVTEMESSLKVLEKSQSELASNHNKDDKDALPPFSSAQLDTLRDIAQEAGATAAMAEGTRLQRRMADAVETCRTSCQSDAKKALETLREEVQAFVQEEIRAAAAATKKEAASAEGDSAIASATRAARAEARAEVASQMANMVEEAEVTRTALKREVTAEATSEAGRTARRCVEEAEGRILSEVSVIATEAGTSAAKVAIAQSLSISSLVPSHTATSPQPAVAPISKGDEVGAAASEATSGSSSSGGLSPTGVVEVAQELRRLLAPDLAALRTDSMNSPQPSSSPSPTSAEPVLTSPPPLPSQRPLEGSSGLVGLTVGNNQSRALEEDQSAALHDSQSDSFEEGDQSAAPKDDQSADICSPPNTPPNGLVGPSSPQDSFDEEEAEDSMSLSMSASHDLSTLHRFSDPNNTPTAASVASPDAKAPFQGLQHDRPINNGPNGGSNGGDNDRGEGSDMSESMSGMQPGSGLRGLLRASHRVNSNGSSRSSGSRNSSSSSSHRRHRRNSPRTTPGDDQRGDGHDLQHHPANRSTDDASCEPRDSPSRPPSSAGEKNGGHRRPSPPPSISPIPPSARGLPSSLAPLPSLVKSPLPSLGLPNRNRAEVGGKHEETKPDSEEPTLRRHRRRHHTPSRLSPNKSSTSLGQSMDSPNDASVSCDQDTSGTSVSIERGDNDDTFADEEAITVTSTNAGSDRNTGANATDTNTESTSTADTNTGTFSDTPANIHNPSTAADANTLSSVTNDHALSTTANTDTLSTDAGNNGTQSAATDANTESIADTLSTAVDAGTTKVPVPSPSQSSSLEPNSHEYVTSSESSREGGSSPDNAQQPPFNHAPVIGTSTSPSSDQVNELADKQNLSMDDSDDDDDVSFDDDDDDEEVTTSTGGAWHPDEALHWKQEELVAFLRNAPAPLGPTVADLFQAEVVDGKTLALMLPSDLSSPPPEGFGMDPTGLAFKELWRLALDLKAALERENGKKN